MSGFHGIQVYEILENGNLLNGIYTNENLLKTKVDGDDSKSLNGDTSKENDYYIDIEIARKIDYNDKGIEGSYDCRYIESTNNLTTHCNLEISNCNGVYKFTWSNLNGQNWVGLGLMAGTTHIAVSYDEV